MSSELLTHVCMCIYTNFILIILLLQDQDEVEQWEPFIQAEPHSDLPQWHSTDQPTNLSRQGSHDQPIGLFQQGSHDHPIDLSQHGSHDQPSDLSRQHGSTDQSTDLS